MKIDIHQMVPGGIKSTDFVHRRTNDNTCSRCRVKVPEEQVPLLLWAQRGEDLLIYCEDCLCPAEEEPPSCS